MVDDERRHEIGIVASDASTAKEQDRLRHIKLIEDLMADALGLCVGDVLQFGAGRERAKCIIKQAAQSFSVYVTHDGDLERVAGQDSLGVRFKVVNADTRNRGEPPRRESV